MAQRVGLTRDAFLKRVLSSEDPQALSTLDLTVRELEVVIAAMNTLGEETLEINNLNQVVRKARLAPHFISALKGKKVVERGDNKGLWIFTKSFMKRVEDFLALPRLTAEEAAEASAHLKPRARGLDKVDERLMNPDLDDMSIGDIKGHVQDIDDRILYYQNKIDDLNKTKTRMKEETKRKLGL
jgi:hypothetical protein